jgi:hypothetical protein
LRYYNPSSDKPIVLREDQGAWMENGIILRHAKLDADGTLTTVGVDRRVRDMEEFTLHAGVLPGAKVESRRARLVAEILEFKENFQDGMPTAKEMALSRGVDEEPENKESPPKKRRSLSSSSNEDEGLRSNEGLKSNEEGLLPPSTKRKRQSNEEGLLPPSKKRKRSGLSAIHYATASGHS